MSTAHMPSSMPSPGPTPSLERILFPPFSLSRKERAAIDDAARLAQLWDVALQASFELGFRTGHQQGVRAGRAEEAAAWQAIVTGYSELIDAPTRVELARVRRPGNKPCASRCGACSQCIRAGAAARNLARYDCPDYPGSAPPERGRTQARHAPRKSGSTPRRHARAQQRKDRS